MNFEETDYKEILKAELLQRKERVSRSFTFQAMAAACRVQKTYLSRVLNGDAHLNDDQLYLACEYLGLSTDESEYLHLLHQHERSVIPKKRQQLQARLTDIQKQQLRSEAHLRSDIVEQQKEDLHTYFLDPSMQLVHMFLSVAKYQDNLAAIREVLGIEESVLNKIILDLERLGLVEHREGRYQCRRDKMHLPQASSLHRASTALMRLRGIDQSQKIAAEDTYNFSVVFSSEEGVQKRIQKKFLQFLKEVEAEVGESKSEAVFQMTFDLFRWSK